MKDNKVISVIKTITIILIIGVAIYLCLNYEKNTNTNYIPMTKTERIQSENEELKERNNHNEEQISHLNSQVEELESKLEEAEDYIEILIEQLERNGIEPDEL